MRGRFAEIGRYLLVGSANTLSTMAVYQLLVTILSPAVAYALAWLVGLVIVAVAYPKIVFARNGRLGARRSDRNNLCGGFRGWSIVDCTARSLKVQNRLGICSSCRSR